jgi:hypothetical protein
MWPRSALRTAFIEYRIREILISTYSAVVHGIHGAMEEKQNPKTATAMRITRSVTLPSVLTFHSHCRFDGSDKPFEFVRSCGFLP